MPTVLLVLEATDLPDLQRIAATALFLLPTRYRMMDDIITLRFIVIDNGGLMFDRKFILSAGLLAILMYGISSTTAVAGNTVVYISAGDCVPCARFDATYLEKFTAAMQAKGYAVRRVIVAHLNDIRDQSYWPSDLKPLLAQFGNKGGTPRFLVVHDGRVIQNLYTGSRGRALAGIS
jgi:hypothetical protein